MDWQIEQFVKNQTAEDQRQGRRLTDSETLSTALKDSLRRERTHRSRVNSLRKDTKYNRWGINCHIQLVRKPWGPTLSINN